WSFNPRDALEIARTASTWQMAARHWKAGMGEMYRSFSKRAFLQALRRLLPELQLRDLQPGGAGVRAQAIEPGGALVDDFRIAADERMVHVLNAPSPAATASISIGEHIAALAAGAWDLKQRGGGLDVSRAVA